MKLLYQSANQGLSACLLALRLAGLNAHTTNENVPLVALQLDEIDHNGNPVEVVGELSICRHIMDQSPRGNSDNIDVDEWILNYIKPLTEKTPRSAIKTSEELLAAIEILECSIKGEFIGNTHPISTDILAFAYLFKYFTSNPWMMNRFPSLGESHKKLSETHAAVQEDLGVKMLSKPKKQVEYLEGKYQIKRVKKKILPESGRRNVLITSALPSVNNIPHLGNIIGCVLSADVYARYCRLRGYNTLYVCGNDGYGTVTENRAIKEGLTPQQICDKYHAIHKKIYDWFDIDFDYFGLTTTQHHTDIAQDIFSKLNQNQELSEADVEQMYCIQCQRFLPDRFVHGTCPSCNYINSRGDQCDSCGSLCNAEDLVNPRCSNCCKTPTRKSTRHVFLELPNIKDRLEQWITLSSAKGKWSQNCLHATQTRINDWLKPLCITRDLKWGTPVPLAAFTNKVFYAWFDAPIGYISITANYIDEWQKWWKNPDEVELVQFMGKDNIPFHTAIFPSSLIGTQEPWTLVHSISTTEFLKYEDGKFSKSEGVGVFGDQAIGTGIPNEVYRFYLLSNRPEQSSTIFKWSDLAAKTNNEFITNIGHLCYRLLKFWYKLDQPLGEAGVLSQLEHDALNKAYQLVEKYCKEMENLKIRKALKSAMDISAVGNKYIQDSQLWELKRTDPSRLQTVLVVASNVLRAALLTIEPFIPGFSSKVYLQLGIERTAREDVLLKELIEAGNYSAILSLLSPCTKVAFAAPIIKTISDDQVRILKAKFAGC